MAEAPLEDAGTAFGPMRSFGRIKSRTLKPRQADLLESLLPKIAVAPKLIEALSQGGPQALGYEALWLEIGFGGGEHMAGQAARSPQHLFLGCEPFINGVGSALRHIDEQGLKNVRILNGDVRPLLDQLPDACLDGVYILFPDPWPKTRHHKRRLIQDALLKVLWRVMKPGARLRFATDWADYADWTLLKLQSNGGFDWPVTEASDWTHPPKDHLTTRYETKALGDCKPVFLDFYRR